MAMRAQIFNRFLWVNSNRNGQPGSHSMDTTKDWTKSGNFIPDPSGNSAGGRKGTFEQLSFFGSGP
jgi:hypothetical protein